jgi:hypothetical protein
MYRRTHLNEWAEDMFWKLSHDLQLIKRRWSPAEAEATAAADRRNNKNNFSLSGIVMFVDKYLLSPGKYSELEFKCNW